MKSVYMVYLNCLTKQIDLFNYKRFKVEGRLEGVPIKILGRLSIFIAI